MQQRLLELNAAGGLPLAYPDAESVYSLRAKAAGGAALRPEQLVEGLDVQLRHVRCLSTPGYVPPGAAGPSSAAPDEAEAVLALAVDASVSVRFGAEVEFEMHGEPWWAPTHFSERKRSSLRRKTQHNGHATTHATHPARLS